MRDSAASGSRHLTCRAWEAHILYGYSTDTSNAAAAAKIRQLEGCFLADTWLRCSSVTELWLGGSESRLAQLSARKQRCALHLFRN